MARAVDGGEAGDGRAVQVGAGRGDDAGGEGRGVELVVGRQDQRGADQRRVLGRDVPGGGELLMDGQGRDRLGRHAAVSRRRMRTPVSSMAPRSSTQLGWSQRAAAGSSDEAAIDRREGAASRPRAGAARSTSTAGSWRRTAARRIATGAARPARASAARQPRGVLAAIVEAAVLDQGQRRFEHRRAEVERVGRRSTRPCGRHRAAASAARHRRRCSAARAGPSVPSERSRPRLT